eukprot:2240055-Amphidinium_carterae.1
MELLLDHQEKGQNWKEAAKRQSEQEKAKDKQEEKDKQQQEEAMSRDEHRTAEVMYERVYELRSVYAHRWSERTQEASIEYARVRVQAEQAVFTYEEQASRHVVRCESVLQSRYPSAHAEIESKVQRASQERQILVSELQNSRRERAESEEQAQQLQRELHQLRSQRHANEDPC